MLLLLLLQLLLLLLGLDDVMLLRKICLFTTSTSRRGECRNSEPSELINIMLFVGGWLIFTAHTRTILRD